MKKVYKYENCTVILHIPEDDKFQERLRKASEDFMKKVLFERMSVNGNSNKSRNLREKQVLD